MKSLERMDKMIRDFSDKDLLLVWDSFSSIDVSGNWSEDVTMETWMEAIYSEKSRRGL